MEDKFKLQYIVCTILMQLLTFFSFLHLSRISITVLPNFGINITNICEYFNVKFRYSLLHAANDFNTDSTF